MKAIANDTLTAVTGIRVGHCTHAEGATGCTAVLCPPDTVGSVDVRGGAPGTRETDLLSPQCHVQHISAIVLAGGSAFGLAAMDGATRYLEEQGEGYQTESGFTIPLVAGAILFDLPVGQPGIRPDSAMGYSACRMASTEPVEQGNVGAGTGARCGSLRGNKYASKGGLGSACVRVSGELIVAALVATNPAGDVVDEHGRIIAGMRVPPGEDTFTSTMEWMSEIGPPMDPTGSENTVIGVVATNAQLSKIHAQKVAQMAHDGIARSVQPAHTMYDGDTLFALATGQVPANPSVVGAFAAEAVAKAIRRGVCHASDPKT